MRQTAGKFQESGSEVQNAEGQDLREKTLKANQSAGGDTARVAPSRLAVVEIPGMQVVSASCILTRHTVSL